VVSPPKRRRASRRGEILETFTVMVAEFGYDAVAIRDLAEALNISKGTVLHHFGSKDRILEEVHASYMRRRIDEAELILGQLETPREQLKGMVFQNLITMQLDASATRAFAREIVRFQSDDLMKVVREMRHQYYELLRRTISDGIADGSFRETDPAIVTLQLFGMMNWTWTWFDPEGDVGVEDIARTFIDTILNGLNAGPEVGERDDSRIIEITREAIAAVETAPQNGSHLRQQVEQSN
jgi:AcrR family transcriptional regulator